MKTISFFDTKPYDKIFFEQKKEAYGFQINYYKDKLNGRNARLAEESDAVVAFVNDTVDRAAIDKLYALGIRVLAMRCAGYDNVDLEATKGKLKVVRVPAYSPYAVAEHAMGLALLLNRKLHRAYNRTREYNFSLHGLTGFDFRGKTVGVIGTGKIGQAFIDLCLGFGMKVLAYDPYPVAREGVTYADFDTICREAKLISLHCPLTKDNEYMINADSIAKMQDGVIIINTSRGALIQSEALLEGIKQHKIGAAGLDVYEEETDFFYEDRSNRIMQDDVLARLISMPNVVVTSHQAFLTEEALENIAEVTLRNLRDFFDGKPLQNEVK
ncbi:MAG: 2-hydroxyacid dehydrogenase [Lachnospiraceae bacterium]|nr:2-hydroxyacid dehydrogenase [Lachnospiraceae bacterium]